MSCKITSTWAKASHRPTFSCKELTQWIPSVCRAYIKNIALESVSQTSFSTKLRYSSKYHCWKKVVLETNVKLRIAMKKNAGLSQYVGKAYRHFLSSSEEKLWTWIHHSPTNKCNQQIRFFFFSFTKFLLQIIALDWILKQRQNSPNSIFSINNFRSWNLI